MPSKKKKYNARFPAGRIKKIMQSDEEIGKVAQAVPVIISRTLELFVESLINKTLKITNSRNAKTLSTSHMKQCIMAEQRFDFLRELVKNIPDISVAEEAANYQEDDAQSSPEQQIYPDSDTPYDLSMQSTSTRAPRNRNNNGELKQQHVKNRHSENGNTTMAPYVMPSHEEHMRPFVEGRGNLKRQVAMTSHSFSEDVGVSSQRNSSKANLYENETHGIVHGEKLTTHEDEKLAHLDREASIRKHINQRQTIDYPSIATPNSSVIRHTISFSTTDTLKHDLPPKLYRTDSAPATAAGDWQSQSHDTMFSYKKSVSAQHQKRLKHQPQSEPTIFNPLATANISETALNTNVQVKPLEIPAPVVNIDFSNKPVVKIEYKNLGNPAQTSILPIAPLSAPATVTNKNMSGFNFESAPVINIDLSNIVADSSNPRSDPAVATISIGNIAPIPSFIKPLVAAPTNLEKNSKSMTSSTGRTVLSTIETKNDATPSSSTSSVPVPKNINSFFELDEDYDNI